MEDYKEFLVYIEKKTNVLKLLDIESNLSNMDEYKKYLSLHDPYIDFILENLKNMNSKNLLFLSDGMSNHVPIIARNIMLNFSSENILKIILNLIIRLERDEYYNQTIINILRIIISDHEFYLLNSDIKYYLTNTWFYFANDTVEFIDYLDEVIGNFLCLFQLDTGNLFNFYLNYLNKEQNELHNHSQNVHLILDNIRIDDYIKTEIETLSLDVSEVLAKFSENVLITILKMPSYKPTSSFPSLIQLANYIIKKSKLEEFGRWLETELYDHNACVALLYSIMIYTVYDSLHDSKNNPPRHYHMAPTTVNI
uniref:Uncharacterized protein n=1 Tax=Dikerogammarus haemobaphes virus 1 TaxID=2704946 RepID=A0A6G9HE04_9VIRU|nr:hypothetical protein [Dikerogammarus haemobaphes virus 1]